MKYVGILLCIICVMIIDCDDLPEDAGEATADDPTTTEWCCGTAEDYSTTISGVAPPGGRYYWMGMLQHDRLVKVGPPAHVSGWTFQGVPLGLSVSAEDSIAEGYYFLRVYATDSLSGVGIPAKSVSQEEAGVVHVASSDSCIPCCTPGRKYAFLAKLGESLTGILATIETDYGLSCGEAGSTELAYSVAYVSIGRLNGSHYWAQAGYGWERRAGLSSVQVGSYVEVALAGGGHLQRLYEDRRPLPGQYWTYQCDIDTTSGRCFFTINGSPAPDTPFCGGFWDGSGTEAIWGAEIYNIEDDMVGTPWDNCSFTDCMYKDSTYHIMWRSPDDSLHSDDEDQWGIERPYMDAIDIWDKKPLR